MGDIFHEAVGARIADPSDDDRNGRRLMLQLPGRHNAIGNDHVRGKAYQLGRVGVDAVAIATGEAEVHSQVVPFHPAELRQRLSECEDGDGDGGGQREHADPPHRIELLAAQSPCRPSV